MGIFDKIKNVFSNSDETTTQSEKMSPEEKEFEFCLSQTYDDIQNKKHYLYDLTVTRLDLYSDVNLWDDPKKIRLLLYFLNSYTDYSADDDKKAYTYNSIRSAFVKQMMRGKLAFTDAEARLLIDAMPLKDTIYGALYWPLGAMVGKIERKYKKVPLTEEIKSVLASIKDVLKKAPNYGEEKATVVLLDKINVLLDVSEVESLNVTPVFFAGDDELKVFADGLIEALPVEERSIWYLLIRKAQNASGSKPSAKYLKETKELFQQLGADRFKKMVNAWFQFVVNEKVKEQTQRYETSVGVFREYSYHTFLSSINLDLIKGFVWMCSHFHDNQTIQTISALAEKSFKKIPGKGPVAAALGNACLFMLYESKGMEGIGQLSRLKLRIKQSNTQGIIEKYLQSAAKEKGMSIHEVEDLAVDDYGLENGMRTWLFDDYKGELKISGIGKTELNWYKPDGSLQKSVPAFVKEKHAAKLKKIKSVAKQVEQTVSAQRDRLDRMFRSKRTLTMENFHKSYIDHGLMAYLTHKIIWKFQDGENSFSAILVDGNWTTAKDEQLQPSENAVVSQWHPAAHTVAEIKEWRDFLMKHQILQPMKQAYREVYWLTDAEVNTRSYSNRMAAHLLKQHQFNSLAKARGWSYSLMGAYDDGIDNGSASVSLPDYDLKAEFWVNEVNMDDAYNDTGIWNYVSTDQVRFTTTSSREAIDLVRIEPIAFSEVMRDVDLFVGVASVGNDPNWQDTGGIQVYRDYWQSYSFGDLSEVAKTRKEILTGLIPRLKIAKVAEISDKFLIVKGKLRTYKIHIGSTNILMEPNDQYLCIVADRSKKNPAENLFLPFEGDNGLSIILSKAFLLADDDKITDSTITSQINRA